MEIEVEKVLYENKCSEACLRRALAVLEVANYVELSSEQLAYVRQQMRLVIGVFDSMKLWYDPENTTGYGYVVKIRGDDNE